MKKMYCTAPFNSLTIREDGSVRTCCPGETILGNLNTQSIESIIHGTKLHKIKESLLSNRIPQNCNFCITQEKSGLKSARSTYEKYTSIDSKLRFLDIRWNILCNLSCIYCSENFSSKWEKLKHLESTDGFNPDKLLSWIESNSNNLEDLMLAGGEPLLMKENISLLKMLPNTTNITLITNLSCNIKKNTISQLLLSKFHDTTVWNISLENFGKKLEYVRSGVKSSQIEENIEYLVGKNAKINLACQYAIFSCFNIKDTIEHYYNLGVRNFYFSPILFKPVLDVLNYPVSILKMALDSIIEVDNWKNNKIITINGLDSFKKILVDKISSNADSILTREDFLREISENDKFNKLKFQDLWIEYSILYDSF